VIPIRDTIVSITTPIVTYALIAANVAVYVHQDSLGPGFERFIETYGLVPRRFVRGWWTDATTLFSSMFVHGGWLHLLGNMLYLHIFGDNVEDRLGHGRYLLLYLLAGVTAGVAQVAIHPSSTLPMVGASGAIAGVTGAYFVFYPRARVVTLVPIFIFIQVVEIPAFFFLLIWFAFQLISGVGNAHTAAGGGIAFWAHIGGFVTGVLVGPALAGFSPRVRRYAG